MNKQQLLQRLQDIEWDNFEVKIAQTDIPKDVWETVSALANTSGGWVVFGVSQKKKVFEIVGVENPEKIENDMLTTLRSKTKFNVKLSPQAKKNKLDGKTFNHAEPRYTYRIAEQENLWEYYFVLFQRLQVYANNPLTIGEMGIGHEDTKEIDALREALVNLLIHTDYFSPMKPRIRVFTNRIEFENPGALPRPVEELLIADESYPRNPVLAKFFRIAKLCESAGYGFDKMLEWKYQTKNDVIFESTVDKTKFTFMLDTTKAMKEESGMNYPDNNQIKQPENNQKTDESVENNIENSVENNIGKLTNNQKKIIENIKNNPFVTSKELSDIIGITSDNILVNISKLKNKGIIRREGADKGGKWIIIKAD